MYICRMKLTIKQEKFCNKYIECGNASEAYRFAYDCSRMKPESVNRLSNALLNDIKITSRVQELQEELKKKSDISKERIVKELDCIMKAKINDYVKIVEKEYENIKIDENGGTQKVIDKYLCVELTPFNQLSEEQLKAVESVKQGRHGIELKLYSKPNAIERVCKMFGYDAPIKQDVKLNEDTVKLIVGMKVE